MSEKDEEKTENLVFDLDFAPSWARVEPDANLQRYREEDKESEHQQKSERSPRPKKNDRRREGKGPFRPKGERPPRKSEGGDNRPVFRREPRPQTPPLPVHVRVLPEQKALGAVIRKIQSTRRAFPMKDLAELFLKNLSSCLVRIEPLKDEKIVFHQCKICGMPALSEEEIRTHVCRKHMAEFFDVEEIECEAPSGQFVCVAKCGLSGELLGPPNHHSFKTKVAEMLRVRYPSMTEEAYRAKIEMIRDKETIEQWRAQCTKKTVYRRKPETPPKEGEEMPQSPAIESEVAENLFIREIAPKQMTTAKAALCTAATALESPSRAIAERVRSALNREKRHPVSLFFALRGAFRHRALFMFKVNDAQGQDFVQLAKPVELQPDHAVQALRDVLAYINEHPGVTKEKLLKQLAGDDEAKQKENLALLAWLVEKGHAIHFYNDTIAPPAEHPFFAAPKPPEPPVEQ